MDLFAKCYAPSLVDEYKEKGIYPYFHALETRQGPEVIMEGQRRIMLGSNNYLGLTSCPEVVEAGIRALEEFGTGCSGSRFLNGTLTLHLELEAELARFLRKEAVMTFSTGFQSNLGIISALVGRSDLERCLQQVPETAGALVITDGVFSMGGDIADLPNIVRLARQYGARVMVDDAHGLGTIGEGGRGTASHFGLEDQVDVYMGTFSKSLASLGGYMAADERVVDYVRHASRPFIFSASIPPASCATALAALRHLEAHPELPRRLADLSDHFRGALTSRGLAIRESRTPIVPIFTYEMERTLRVAKALYDNGVYVNTVLPPAAPTDGCMLRTSLMATHTEALLDEAADVIQRVCVRSPWSPAAPAASAWPR